jgi:hypothetical protein
MPTRYLTERALVERCRRVLRLQGIMLRENGTARGRVGRLHTVDAATGVVLDWGVTLRRLARRLRVLRPWEALADPTTRR